MGEQANIKKSEQNSQPGKADTEVNSSLIGIWPALLLGLLVVILYWPAINEFIYDWSNDDNYSHGFLIPVISGYLLWQSRKRIRAAQKSVWPFGSVILIVGLVLNILGTAAAEWFTVRFSLVLVLLGCSAYLFGRQVLRQTWFPITFLAFAIPWPYALFRTLTFPLQLFSTKVTALVISSIGVSVLQQGNLLHVPGYSLEVVEACSGLRSIITLSALAAVFAYLSDGGIPRRIILFCMAIPIAIVANVIRLFVTTLGAMLISPSFAEGFLHDFSGILVFGAGLLMFFVTNIVMGKLSAMLWHGREQTSENATQMKNSTVQIEVPK